MKNNFVAKNAQRSGHGYHSDKSKPDVNDDDIITVRCLTCGEYSDILDHEIECPACGALEIIEIGGLQ